MRADLSRMPISLRQRPRHSGQGPHAANGNLQPPLCGTLNVRSLRWDYPMPSDGKLIFNTRLERAPFSALWSNSFKKRRCIVPVMAFYESSSSEYALNPTGRKVKQTYRFGCGKPAGESSEENLEAAATEHESSVETRPFFWEGFGKTTDSPLRRPSRTKPCAQFTTVCHSHFPCRGLLLGLQETRLPNSLPRRT